MMKKKRAISLGLVLAMLCSIIPLTTIAAYATDGKEYQATASAASYGINTAEDSYINAVKKIAEQCDVVDSSQQMGEPVIWYDVACLYDLIPDAARIVEFTQIDTTYYISYDSFENGFVTVTYYPDGAVETLINPNLRRFGEGSNLAVKENQSVEESTCYELTRIMTDSVSNTSVTEVSLEGSDVAVSAATKRVELPSPVECGHRDTGIEGIHSYTTGYVAILDRSLSVRVSEVESEYKRKSGVLDWLSYGAGTTVTTVGAALGLSTGGLTVFLGIAGVALAVIDGATRLQEAIQINSYVDFTATEGYYGDIYDPTLHYEYVRVIPNVGTSQYLGGIDASGNFSFVKRSYSGILSKAEVISKTIYNYNMDVAANGICTSYYPAEY